MSLELVRFEPRHIASVATHPLVGYIDEVGVDWAAVAEAGHCYTLMDGDRILMCAGVTQHWPGRGEAWAAIDQGARKTHPIAVVKAAQVILESSPLNRIEAVVLCDGFLEGHRFVKLLGFELETDRMKGFHPGGRDCSMYVRLKS